MKATLSMAYLKVRGNIILMEDSMKGNGTVENTTVAGFYCSGMAVATRVNLWMEWPTDRVKKPMPMESFEEDSGKRVFLLDST